MTLNGYVWIVTDAFVKHDIVFRQSKLNGMLVNPTVLCRCYRGYILSDRKHCLIASESGRVEPLKRFRLFNYLDSLLESYDTGCEILAEFFIGIIKLLDQSVCQHLSRFVYTTRRSS